MKTIKQTIHCLCLALVMFVPASGFAVEPDADPWYEIEVIVFEPVEPPLTTEKWPQIIEEPALDTAVGLLAPVRQAGNPQSVVPFRQLDPASLQLTPQAKRLAAGNRYRVLLHTAWRQPLQENGPETAVYISSLPRNEETVDLYAETAPQAVPNHVDGVITLLLTRYLHIKAHLVYTNPEVDLARQIIEQDNSSPVTERFVMKESRRVKLQELHYFDHPYFGLIARIIRYEPPRPDAQPASQ
ncbi:MAG: CsiV family protein [Granulosicoccaceae bacterium]